MPSLSRTGLENQEEILGGLFEKKKGHLKMDGL
jgi:hypothetical protein